MDVPALRARSIVEGRRSGRNSNETFLGFLLVAGTPWKWLPIEKAIL